MPQTSGFRSILIISGGVLLFLAFPTEAAQGVRTGLQLCAAVLIPSLFPVSVLTGCMIRMGAAARFRGRIGAGIARLFCCSGTELVPVLLGLVGGYPLGAMVLSDLCQNGAVPRQQAARISALCNHAGPAFLIGAVGAGVFADVRTGVSLWLIQLFSLLMTARVLPGRSDRGSVGRGTEQAQAASFSVAFSAALEASALAMLRLSGTVAFFAAFHAILSRLLPVSALPQFWQAGIYGSLELSGALSLLGSIGRDRAFVLSAVLSVWGGLCVHAQSLQAFSSVGLRAGPYLLGKLIQSIFAGLLALLWLAMHQRMLSSAAFFGTLLLCTFFLDFFAKNHWKTKKTVL